MNPEPFHYRIATDADIAGMQIVRRSVVENALSSPGRLRDEDYIPFLNERGRGWVCVEEEMVVGFAIADLQEHNIWALFILPSHEKRGIGKELHRLMMNWYFSATSHPVWLSTAFHTRAEEFYRRQGWRDEGPYNAIERKFEMTPEEWKGS